MRRSIDLVKWRAEMERRFRFNPEHGITLDNLKSIGDAVTRRYQDDAGPQDSDGQRAAQDARRRRQRTGWPNRSRRSTPTSANGVSWHANTVEFQQSRRPFERLLNQSPLTVLGTTLGVLAVGAAVLSGEVGPMQTVDFELPGGHGHQLGVAGQAGEQFVGGIVAERGNLSVRGPCLLIAAFVAAFDDQPRQVFVDRQQLEDADAAAIAAIVAERAALRFVDPSRPPRRAGR